MITVRKMNLGSNKGYTWVDARDVNREDLSVLTEEYMISSDLMSDILDQDEQSRVEKEDEYTAIIARVPLDDDDSSPIKQNSIPLGIILFPETVVTICLGDSVVLEDFARKRFRQYPVQTREGFVISILGRSALVFIRILKYINRQKEAAEERLKERVQNAELLQMLEIQKSLVYLNTSITSNEMLIEKLMKTPIFRLNSEDEQEFFEDVLIDNRQAIAMAQNYADTLVVTMDAYANVINNNMNNYMKRLTVFSLGMMFPTFITGFYGMNVALPLHNWPWAWILLFSFCIGSALFGTWVFWDRKNKVAKWDEEDELKNKKRKKKS
ncbi:MAG: magnesium transporter CorA family protein [Spirochaetales bacterium]|nr:magnesium transporter CorA family protein [Spirochaetales bacterium]